MREGIATRHSALQDAAGDEVASAFTPTTENAFDSAIQSATADALQAPAASEWTTVVVRRGQTLSDIFAKEGIGLSEAVAIVGLGGDAARLKSLKTGEKLSLRKTDDDQLDELNYEFDETHTLQVRRSDSGYDALTIEAEIEHRPAQLTGVITSSLFAAAQKAGLSNRLVMELADIFGYDIDFALDLRDGDRFSVVYDQLYKDGKKLRDGDIVAAEFVNRGQAYRAMRYVDADGNATYYTPEGASFRKAFIRTPVDFIRISSGFTTGRRHPILNVIRAHKGVDYAAAIGTPVKATGDGIVDFVGVKSGYGNVVSIRHGTKYTTLYGHLSRFRAGLKVGQRVRQGQLIAYVGMTGLATGPHLHYEFRVNGLHQNPLTVALPRANPLPKSVVARWRLENATALAQLDALSSTRTAQLDTPAEAPPPALHN
ncbi:OapA family protein [Solimonas variicoloris]|uniref:OapA family protein n=1 Tax=Solimonas variicoloris TaxID=254408 RepID=UPI00036D0D7F|nr:peptidoglycan DD-metalloendopeptidase family protein [Solimonas variicoloris]